MADSIRAYYKEVAESNEVNREVKAVLIGNGYVGKTTLAFGLVHGAPPPADVHERTHGIATSTLSLRITGEDEPLSIVLWDFGGQDLYHATHRLFLHANALYLLLWAEETDEAPDQPRHPVSYWLSLVHELAKDSPVFLIKNQIDRRDGSLLPPMCRTTAHSPRYSR